MSCKRQPLLAVLLMSQVIGLALLVPVMMAFADAPPAASFLGLGALAGVFNAIALAALYRGLAGGTMGLVAPIAATDAVIPVAFGLLTGEHPATLEVVGIVL